MSAIASQDVEVLAGRLRLASARLQRRLRRESPGELGASAWSALASIARRGPLGLSELADAEHVSRPTMTSITTGLERAGWVRREGGLADRRRVYVSLTPAGRRLVERARSRRSAFLARRLRRLSSEDLHHLTEAVALLELLAEEP